MNPDPTTLTWCQRCGCRHRTMWMRWNTLGHYICTVCCLDYPQYQPRTTKAHTT